VAAYVTEERDRLHERLKHSIAGQYFDDGDGDDAAANDVR
jgi:hypothetical protein